MKKIQLALILLLTFSGLVKAQDISTVIFSMPDELTLKIPDDQKEILSALPEDTAIVTVSNILGGDVERVTMTNDYVAIKTSDIGMLQIKLLPLINNSYIIAVVKTVCDQACDSQIDFYTTDWKHLSTADLFPKKDKQWFIRKDIDRDAFQFQNAYAALDMTPIEYILSPNDGTVTATYDIKKYLSSDDYKLLEPYLSSNPVIFTWDKNSFKR